MYCCAHLNVLHWILIFVDLCLFFCSVVGNSVVIYVISRDKKCKNKSNYHILSVACVDLLIAMFAIPADVTEVSFKLIIQNFQRFFARFFGDLQFIFFVRQSLFGAPHDFQLCVLANSMLLSLVAVSLFSLLAVSIDRYWAVCYPMTYHVRGPNVTIMMIVLCWVLGFILGFPPVLGWNNEEFDGVCDLRRIVDFNYLLYVCVGTAVTTAIAIFIIYALIYKEVIKQVSGQKFFCRTFS